MISAKVIADSQNLNGNRLTTLELVMPRYILAEFNTHRAFSRNSASSRAIRFENMIEKIRHDPFIPIAFQKDHAGMQGKEYFKGQDHIRLRNAWNDMRWKAVEEAEKFATLGVTKQLCNRPIEPYMWHTVLVSATEWDNFFELRCPQYIVYNLDKTYYKSKKDLLKSLSDFPQIQAHVEERSIIDWLEENDGQADIHMMALAEAIWDARNESTPKLLKTGDWHIPYNDSLLQSDELAIPLNLYDRGVTDWALELSRLKIATARCARISYKLPGDEDKVPDYAKDIQLHDRLVKFGHWSPFEHCAQAARSDSRNFKGFIQYRAQIDGI